jgi:peroxiredoxin family protein/TusA-related sulfurtransferase/rhodanese-related sulfurtransferase
VQVTNPITDGPTAIPLAGPANRQARVAADNLAGRTAQYRGTQGTSVVKVFDLAVASTGMNARQLAEQDIPFHSTTTHSPDHASYYPGASDMTTKLLYSPEDGRLLGAQVVGTNGVDRTIDVLATALAAGMSAFDLEHLELAYAPPFGSAKDVVNIAGFVAANRLRGDTDIVQWDDLAHLDPVENGLLDVRTQLEHDLGHIEGSVHIRMEQLRQRIGELSKDKRWVVYCKIGRRAYIAERILRQHGFSVANLSGGWNTYEPPLSEQRGLHHSTADRPVDECIATPVSISPQAGGNGHEPTLEVDACGLQCPGPILAVYREMQKMEPTQVLKVTATDPGFARDIGAWAERTGNHLMELNQEGATLTALIQKRDLPATSITVESGANSRAKTIVVFSGDLDKALASFIIANGAAAMGKQVTMFFTFWGLNVLRRSDAVPVSKNLVERMFGWMMPRGAKKLKLSQMHMAGAGTAMIKAIMKAKNVDSLQGLIRSAQENGVRLVACQMSMDLMGIKAEELIDGVEIGGVATYVAASDEANANLFI